MWHSNIMGTDNREGEDVTLSMLIANIKTPYLRNSSHQLEFIELCLLVLLSRHETRGQTCAFPTPLSFDTEVICMSLVSLSLFCTQTHYLRLFHPRRTLTFACLFIFGCRLGAMSSAWRAHVLVGAAAAAVPSWSLSKLWFVFFPVPFCEWLSRELN